jgi:hypothetical protein
MDPLTIALITAGISAAGSALGAGIEGKKARTASGEAFTEDDARRLRELQQMREAGALGLTEEQQASLDAQFRQQGAQQVMEAQAQQLAAQAARPASARDVFLQEAAGQLAQQQAITEQNLVRLQADEAAAARQEQELQQLLMQRMQAQQIAAGAPSASSAGIYGLAAQAPDIAAGFAESQMEQERLDALLEAYQPSSTQQNPYQDYIA